MTTTTTNIVEYYRQLEAMGYKFYKLSNHIHTNGYREQPHCPLSEAEYNTVVELFHEDTGMFLTDIMIGIAVPKVVAASSPVVDFNQKTLAVPDAIVVTNSADESVEIITAFITAITEARGLSSGITAPAGRNRRRCDARERSCWT